MNLQNRFESLMEQEASELMEVVEDLKKERLAQEDGRAKVELAVSY